MADPSAAEIAYQQIKRSLSEGRLPAGALDIRRLADACRLSPTPVREALARLSGEGLVTRAPTHGYVVTLPSAQRLEYLYDLNGQLVDLCFDRLASAAAHTPGRSIAYYGKYAVALTDLLHNIGKAQPNPELAGHMAAIGDRLALARVCEPDVFPDAYSEITTLLELWAERQYKDLRRALHRHHAARIAHASFLARAISERPITISKSGARP